MIKKFLTFALLAFSLTSFAAEEADPDKYFDMKQEAFALYNTNHLDEAFKILNEIPDSNRDENIYLIMANIEEEKADRNTIGYIKAAIRKNPEFYKAYYNLGLIYMKRRIYTAAIENFKLAAKYNKKNAYSFYNLGCAQMQIGDFSAAKKNFSKAILLKNDEKDFYYNLAFADKKLGKEKEAKKIIDFYNTNFVK